MTQKQGQSLHIDWVAGQIVPLGRVKQPHARLYSPQKAIGAFVALLRSAGNEKFSSLPAAASAIDCGYEIHIEGQMGADYRGFEWVWSGRSGSFCA